MRILKLCELDGTDLDELANTMIRRPKQHVWTNAAAHSSGGWGMNQAVKSEEEEEEEEAEEEEVVVVVVVLMVVVVVVWHNRQVILLFQWSFF